jgi:hypothetical protein
MSNRFNTWPGGFELLSDVYFEKGHSRETPRPHRYQKRAAGGYYFTNNWTYYGSDGVMQNDYFNANSSSVVFPSPLAWMPQAQTEYTVDFGELSDKAMDKIYEQLRGNSELVVDLAEASQTVKMVRDALQFKRNIGKFLKELATKPKKTQRIATTVAGKWLEYRYGWLPLIGSIYDAGDNLLRKIREEDIDVKARASSRRDTPKGVTTGTPGTDSYSSWRAMVNTSARFEIGLTLGPPSPTAQRIANWTSLNPATIAWELVPLSFVVDWFVNVGDQLRSWENWVLYSGTFKSGYQTKVVRELRVGTYQAGIDFPKPVYWPDGQLKQGYYGTRAVAGYTVYFVDKKRELLSGLPVPSGLRVKVNLNANRVADAAALTSKLWKRFL